MYAAANPPVSARLTSGEGRQGGGVDERERQVISWCRDGKEEEGRGMSPWRQGCRHGVHGHVIFLKVCIHNFMFWLNPKLHMSDKCARCGGPSPRPMIPNDLRKGQVEKREGGDGGDDLTPKMHWWLFLQADGFSCTHTGARPHMQLVLFQLPEASDPTSPPGEVLTKPPI
ncbi:hypothetical protein CgunFtcFv8_001762 [Champsocephalus gunnari]|uniref:Uncharacterized protein n=1 Tax=Champsocephalus gunnari TaxID=52237 RepID=A0AAN8HAR5_CHAGU|nr:hypothetical protein CgunFtcFv8_001762 [Champsocephalus gunnari]